MLKQWSIFTAPTDIATYKLNRPRGQFRENLNQKKCRAYLWQYLVSVRKFKKNLAHGRHCISQRVQTVAPTPKNLIKYDQSCVMCYLLPVTCYLLPVTCYLLPGTWYLLTVFCYMLPVTCSMLPVTLNLSPFTCYLLPLIFHLSTVTCHLLPVPCQPVPEPHSMQFQML